MNTLNDLLAAASNPSTPPDCLAALANSDGDDVPRAVAKNPNAPEELLRELWGRFPESILENPLLTLWEFTEAGSTLRKLGDRLLLALYNHLRDTGAELPGHIFSARSLAEMARSGWVNLDPAVFRHLPFEEDATLRYVMIEHPHNYLLQEAYTLHAPDAVWERFATDPHPGVRLQFSMLLRYVSERQEPGRSEIHFTAARHLANDARAEVHEHLAHCKWLPADVVERLSTSPSVRVRAALGSCRCAPLPVLRQLARDSSEEVRAGVARHAESGEIHSILLRDRSADVRTQLAKNPSLTRDELDLFDTGDKAAVLEAVFAHPNADEELRTKILKEASLEMHGVLARNATSLTPRFYRAVKHLVSPDALAQLAEASGLKRDIVEDLARNPDPVVRLGVARRLSNRHNSTPHQKNIVLVNAFACDPDPRVRKKVCIDWRLEKSIARALFSDPDAAVRKKMLRALLASLVGLRNHRRLHSYRDLYREKASLVATLARDPERDIRDVIANCPEAPPRALGILFNDPDPGVRDAVRGQTRWPYGVMIDLVRRIGSRIDGVSVYHGDTTPGAAALRVLAGSRNPFVRHLVASCSRTARPELHKLSEDAHPAVRETARRRLGK